MQQGFAVPLSNEDPQDRLIEDYLLALEEKERADERLKAAQAALVASVPSIANAAPDSEIEVETNQWGVKFKIGSRWLWDQQKLEQAMTGVDAGNPPPFVKREWKVKRELFENLSSSIPQQLVDAVRDALTIRAGTVKIEAHRKS